MERPPIGFAIFITVCGVAFIGMMVVGRSRRAHTAAAQPSSATASANDPREQMSPEERRAALRAQTQGGRMRMEPSQSVPGEAAAMPVDVPYQEPVGPVGFPPGYRGVQATNYMRMRLRELTMAEEQYYNEANAYTTDLSKLMLMRRTGDVVVLRVTFAGPTGYVGVATHPSLPGKSCVMYSGPSSYLPAIPTTTADHAQPLGERDLVCDKP